MLYFAPAPLLPLKKSKSLSPLSQSHISQPFFDGKLLGPFVVLAAPFSLCLPIAFFGIVEGFYGITRVFPNTFLFFSSMRCGYPRDGILFLLIGCKHPLRSVIFSPSPIVNGGFSDNPSELITHFVLLYLALFPLLTKVAYRPPTPRPPPLL